MFPPLLSPHKPRISFAIIAIVFLALLLSAFRLPSSFATSAPAPIPGSSSTIFINEIHYDNAGTDTGEFIEVAGPAGTDLTGWRIELYNGAGGARYDDDPLSGTIPSQQGGYGTVSISYPSNGIQNGSPDGLALINSSNTVVQFLCYEGSFTATSHTANGLTCTDIGVSESGSNAVGTSLQLQGSGTTDGDFTWTTTPIANTQDNVNTGQSFGAGVSLSINDATVTEGDSGTVTASFTVTLSSGSHSGVTFDIATQNDSATTADNDYVAKTLLNQSIPSGSASYNFDVTVNGDTDFEPNERFFVNVTNVSGATVSDGTGVGTITNDDCPPPAADVVISQVYGGGGNTGATFTHDFIELFNQSAATVDLSGWSVQYTSAAGTGTWSVTPLTGSIAPGGYYLIQEAQGTGGTTPLPTPDAVGSIAMSATAGKVALSSTTTASTGACPTCFIDLVGYGSTANCFEGTGPTAAPSNTTAVIRRRSGCRDTDNNNADFSIGSPNPRNTASPINDCTIPARAIHDIQGNGTVSPFNNQDVSTTGIVTALKSDGFFLQEPDATVDSDPATSEGLFVFTGALPTVAAGDAVTVIGTIGEFFNLTQVSSDSSDITVNTSGNTLPNPITITTTILDPAGTPAQLEGFEGMRMSASSLTTTSPSNGFGEVFTVLTGVNRPFREAGIEQSLSLPPGSPCCVPRFDENPELLMVDTDGQLGSTAITLTSFVTMTNVTGPLDFTFGNYKVLPDTPPTVTANLSATAVPAAATDEFTVASFNLENFFSTFGNFNTKLDKASLAIRNVMRSPDIIGVEEVGDLTTLQALATRLNTDSGGTLNYVAYLEETDLDAENDIDVGFLVNSALVNVTSVTQYGATETFINPLNNQAEPLNDRAPLVLRASVQSPTGSSFPVTVIVNHLRSLIDIDQDPGDGPRVREKRRKQAEYLAGLIDSFQDAENLVVVGDFNAFQVNDGYVDVMGTIRGQPTNANEVVLASADLVDPNLTNLLGTISADQQYSFVFEGNAQVLDHVLVDGEMLARTSRFAYARNNADFPDAFQSDGTRSERISDHDMPVAYFKFPPSLTDLDPARVWLGLKNSDDVGTKFDLLAEVFKNGELIGSGQLNDVPGGSSGFNNAFLRTIDLAQSGPVDFYPGDTLSIKLSVRIAASSRHRSGTARFWFNDAAANSRFTATIGGETNDYFLRSGFVLANTAGPGPKDKIDVTVSRVGGNPFKPFGTWSTTY